MTISCNRSIPFLKSINCLFPFLFCLALFSCQGSGENENQSTLGDKKNWREGDKKARKFADKLHEEFDSRNCEKLYDYWVAEITTNDWEYLCSIYMNWGQTRSRKKLPGKWGYLDGVWKVEVRYETVFDKGEFEEVITLVELDSGFKIEGWTFQDLNFESGK